MGFRDRVFGGAGSRAHPNVFKFTDATLNRPGNESAQRAGSCQIGQMKLSNDRYLILIGTNKFTERYYRDKSGWLKVSARGRKFRMTAEQVLNHLLPAAAGIKPNVTLKVRHCDTPPASDASSRA